jgi:maleate isomerase
MKTGREQNFLEHDAWPSWWRARIGLIIPSPGLVSFQEQQTICPKGVAILHTRVMLKETTPEALSKLREEVLYAAELLATAKPEVISYNCTSSALIKGAEYEKAILQKIEEVTGIKATSAALSVVGSLQSLGIKKIVVVAPYLKEVTDAEEKYLESFGFEVVYSETLGMKEPLVFMERPPWENYHFAFNAYRKAPEAEAIFISCGAMRTIEIIEHLERAIGKPVLSSNQCNAWMCLKLAGIKEPIYGYGSLLARER